MPDNLQTGNSLFFWRTNTWFSTGIGTEQLPGFFEDEDMAVKWLTLPSYKQSLLPIPFLHHHLQFLSLHLSPPSVLRAKTTGLFLLFPGQAKMYFLFVCFLFSLLLEVIFKWGSSGKHLPFFCYGILLLQGTQKLDFNISDNHCVSSCWNQIRKSTDRHITEL